MEHRTLFLAIAFIYHLLSFQVASSRGMVLESHGSSDRFPNITDPTTLFCPDGPFPRLNAENCLDAYIQLEDLDISKQLIAWGSSNPLEPGYLPFRIIHGECELLLDKKLEAVPAPWILQDYMYKIARLFFDCVDDPAGPQKGGWVVFGPGGHEIVAMMSKWATVTASNLTIAR